VTGATLKDVKRLTALNLSLTDVSDEGLKGLEDLKNGSSLFLVGDFCLFYFESPSISQEKRSFLLEENR
jgi:hypothetical protein